MTLGIGSSYGMIGGMNPMMGGGNVPQYFTQKYGCADCFRNKPYVAEFPKPMVSIKNPIKSSSFFRKLFNGIF